MCFLYCQAPPVIKALGYLITLYVESGSINFITGKNILGNYRLVQETLRECVAIFLWVVLDTLLLLCIQHKQILLHIIAFASIHFLCRH